MSCRGCGCSTSTAAKGGRASATASSGRKKWETLQREVTGMWMEDVHPRLKDKPALFGRYLFMAEQGEATYRKGLINFDHKREHERVEHVMVPLARDGRIVDVIAACSVILRSDGRAF
jgi:hypothetical protein